MRKEIKKAVLNCDYLVARLPGDLGNIALKYAIKYKIKYLIELVGCAWDALWYHSFLGKMYAPYLFLKTKFFVLNSHYVVYVTKDYLQGRYPTKGYKINISNVNLGPNSNLQKKTITK